MLIGFYLRSETSLPSIEGHLHFTLEHNTFLHRYTRIIERQMEYEDPNSTSPPPPSPVSPSGWWPRPWSRWSPGTACPRARSIVCIWPAGVISSYQVTPWPHILISSYIMASSPHITFHVTSRCIVSSYRCHIIHYKDRALTWHFLQVQKSSSLAACSQ